MKVIYRLGQLGYVETIRGRGGGIRLGMTPEDINIGEVVRNTEDDFNIVECFDSKNLCIISPACNLKNLLNEALQAYLAVLDKYTLRDLVKNKEEIMRLLRS